MITYKNDRALEDESDPFQVPLTLFLLNPRFDCTVCMYVLPISPVFDTYRKERERQRERERERERE